LGSGDEWPLFSFACADIRGQVTPIPNERILDEIKKASSLVTSLVKEKEIDVKK